MKQKSGVIETKPIAYYAVNGITLYRLVLAPILLLLALQNLLTWFRWLMALSFFTDAIDGPLSRKYNVTSVFGARLDSVADDATVLMSMIALWFIYPEFVITHWIPLVSVFSLFGLQTLVAWIAYKRVTSFHTYLAKSAAVAQAIFFILIFFRIGPIDLSFYAAIVLTSVQLVEEIILVLVLPQWKANVKGLYWALSNRTFVK